MKETLPIQPGQILCGPNGLWYVLSRSRKSGRVILEAVAPGRLHLTGVWTACNARDFHRNEWRIERSAGLLDYLRVSGLVRIVQGARYAVVVCWGVLGWVLR